MINQPLHINSRPSPAASEWRALSMKKTIWDWYAPFYKQAMLPDRKSYQYMYGRISQVVKDKLVLEIATGPGLLAKHIAPATKHITATDYSAGMIREAQKGENPKNLSF